MKSTDPEAESCGDTGNGFLHFWKSRRWERMVRENNKDTG